MATRKANFRSASSCAVGRAPGHDLQRHVVDDRVVARLEQQAAGDRTDAEARRARVGKAAGQQQAQVLLRRDQGDGLFVGVGRDDDFGEDLDDFRSRLGVELPVQRDDAAERRNGIAGLGAEIGLRQASRLRRRRRDWHA